MLEDYYHAQILDVSVRPDALFIKLDLTESEFAQSVEKPVLVMKLRNCANAQDAYDLLKNYIYSPIEIYFLEEEGRKYLDISVDYHADSDLELDYDEIDYQKDEYTIEDLRGKLDFLKRIHQLRFEEYNQSEKHYKRIIEGLRNGLLKEIDRYNRKIEFFAGSDKENKLEVAQKSYRRILELLEHLEKDTIV